VDELVALVCFAVAATVRVVVVALAVVFVLRVDVDVVAACLVPSATTPAMTAVPAAAAAAANRVTRRTCRVPVSRSPR
jgi:hypothetical protein